MKLTKTKMRHEFPKNFTAGGKIFDLSDVFILPRRNTGNFAEDSDKGVAAPKTRKFGGFGNAVSLVQQLFAFLDPQGVDIFQQI
jgi:hypothetical protein